MLTLNLINLALKTSIKNNFFSTDIKTEIERFLNKNKYIDKNSIRIKDKQVLEIKTKYLTLT